MNTTTDEEILIEVCRQVGVGFRAVQGAVRTPNVVAARRVVAFTLREQAGWPVRRIALAIRKTERAVAKMLRRPEVRSAAQAEI